MSIDEARGALRAAGLDLVVGSMKLTPPTPHLAERVGSQLPPPGSVARRGGHVDVTLYYATTVEEYEVPSLVGLKETDALARLWDGRLLAAIERSGAPPSASLAGRVWAQHPLAGTLVGYATTVRLQVYGAPGAPPAMPPAVAASALMSPKVLSWSSP